jgi:DNA-binding NarL/FixJ family response regulator
MTDPIKEPGLPCGPRRRVFLVDDHPLVREWLSNLIERQPDLVVCGQAETSAAAYEAIARDHPDIAVVDLSLEAGSGLELIKQLQTLPTPPQVLVLSMHDELLYAQRALRAGARGYVMKRSATRHVIEAIRRVLDGHLYVSDSLASQMAEKYVSGRGSPAEPAASLLSDRELEVFKMLGRGIETRRIAETLHISPKTVQVYCGRIKEKFGLANANELIREAVRWSELEGPV